MNRVTIDLHGLKHNLQVIKRWMQKHSASWTVVTKVLCGHTDTLRALQLLGVRSMGDSRLANLRAIEKIIPDFESWYMRVSDLSSVKEVASLADVSLNSETEVIELLNEEAKRLRKTHKIIIMIELGDLREGILPGSLIKFYECVFELPNIEVIGIGANLGCLAGAVPNVDQFTQLALYRELLELKFDRKLPMISAGSSAVLPILLEGKLPKAINHFRIGEAIFLGTDLVNGGTLPELRDDVVLLEAEIAEIKEKGLVPLSETGSMTPFESETDDDLSPGQRGYRALISVGQLDTDIAGLTPLDSRYRIAGASSDITVVNLGSDSHGLRIGDSIKFRPNYAAMLRLMSGKYVAQEVTPDLSEIQGFSSNARSEVKPAVAVANEQEST
ncbi:MAG: alanine racemase [candidate division Zixibacteria bacterium]|nr:alanine racemase [candidate division Zixibacteria bacterium]MBU1470213.1 alanine racemase [candidate division Zixibacteria bacterium]